MYRILFFLLAISITQANGRFSPFRSAFRISGQASARNNDDDLSESHITLLPSATRSKPLQTATPYGNPGFNMATTKKKIISTLLEMTENEISKKLSQLDSSVENNEVLSSNNKRFTKEPSTTMATERSDASTSSLFELSTEASARQTTAASASTTAKPRKVLKLTTSSTRDAAAAAEAAEKLIANMHSMHFSPNKNINRIVAVNTATSKIPVHHHNPYNDYAHDKINFDVNYRPTEAPPEKTASSSPSKKSKDKNRESVKQLLNGLVNFVGSPLFNQAKPLIVSSFSTVSNALSTNRNAISSGVSSSGGSSSSSSSSASAASASGLSPSVISKMFNSLRFAVLRRNELSTNANKNSKKKGKLNSAVNNPSTTNNMSNQSIMMNLLESLIKTREAFLSLAATPNRANKPVTNKVASSLGASSNGNKNSPKPYSTVAMNLFRMLWKNPGLKQEARSF